MVIFMSVCCHDNTQYTHERKRNPWCVANLHCECQELKPKVEETSSFLVLHPSSGVDTVNTIGATLIIKFEPYLEILSTFFCIW